MQRWFFADEVEACHPPTPMPSSSSMTAGSRGSYGTIERPWKFCVVTHEELAPNEHLAIVGNYESLGNWQFPNCVVMTKEDDNKKPHDTALGPTTKWCTKVHIPRDRATEYRYLVCAIDPSTETKIVRRWEAALKPRIRPAQELVGEVAMSVDQFGCGSDDAAALRIDRGWLTSETVVQLKFYKAPFTWKQRMKPRLMYVKVTPMHLKIPSACEYSGGGGQQTNVISNLEDSWSNDTHDTRENGSDLSTSFAFNEVVTIGSDGSVIHKQPQFGSACGPDDLVFFHLTIGDFESTVYLIDLYAYSSKAAEDEPPCHVGYQYVLPTLLKRSMGYLDVPITCATKHRPVGMMKLSYLIMRPSPSLPLDMSTSYTRYWCDSWNGLDVGHRGLGPSFKANDALIRENTIMSLQNASAHGADMVEFDVQLSKDLVPVVYHDFMIYVSLKSKCGLKPHDFLNLPMRDLTLEQLQNLKVYHTAEGLSGEARCFFRQEDKEHQPFPSLAEVLQAVDMHTGFNVEVKYPQRMEDGTMEEESHEDFIDQNLYVDCILDVIFRYAGERRIVFSSFDPDMCALLRFKQNRYPVMFLALGVSKDKVGFMDPRGRTLNAAIGYAVATELLGIVPHTEDLLRDRTQIHLAKSSGLIVFCWGEMNNSKETIKLLKDIGLHAVIYDKIDQLKEMKQSVFQLEAKESQKEVLQLQALETGKVWHVSQDSLPQIMPQ